MKRTITVTLRDTTQDEADEVFSTICQELDNMQVDAFVELKPPSWRDRLRMWRESRRQEDDVLKVAKAAFETGEIMTGNYDARGNLVIKPLSEVTNGSEADHRR